MQHCKYNNFYDTGFRNIKQQWLRRSVHRPVFHGIFFTMLCGMLSLTVSAQRKQINLHDNWLTTANDHAGINTTDDPVPAADAHWEKVSIPHNWDDYHGYRRLLHGNKHGTAWYKKNITLNASRQGKRFFLVFEGVGSYATVYLNGTYIGEHAGGRTSFTLDITDHFKTDGTDNLLTVRAGHPAHIQDLPWVCGGCSEERGFSEGSQPMGIFRPVQLLVTDDVRIEPFGIHAWANVGEQQSALNINTTVKNYGPTKRTVTITHRLLNAQQQTVKTVSYTQVLQAGDSLTQLQKNIIINKPVRWSVTNPYLYTIVTTVKKNNRLLDETKTSFGFRTIKWHTPTNQFLLNGQAVFMNGIAEYEHIIGQSHAFSKEQVRARMNWIKSTGFNAFRDGHQPHHLLYGQLCNELGILWWTQLSAHIWFDNPAFRSNFKKLLREWMIERRNDPSVVLWGLQNESTLPEDFAKECTELIRTLDPTASTERLVTTCNGGKGTDWDVPQNWTGTYGGNPAAYDQDVKRQVLIGEYGAWRTLDLHTEGGFIQNGPVSEDRMTELMEQKVRLAEKAKDSAAGHFFWLLTSHDNPGRVQGGEGLRELDRIGPVNYKGLLTPWEEPTDVLYMYRSNYTTAPMVYIASHTWPNRWTTPGIKNDIRVYSNCEEVELFNDIEAASLGKRKRDGIGTHFTWDKVNIQFNVLYAVGYVKGKAVARDTIVLDHLPRAPAFEKLYRNAKPLLEPAKGFNYVYRINCGGPAYTDTYQNKWSADRSVPNGNTKNQGSISWTNHFSGMPAFFASQRRTNDPIKNTRDWPLFQSFRYGREQLSYHFPLPDGEYRVELYFNEPWLGIGGGMDAGAMRLFDVAVNDKVVLKDLDIWKEAGTNTALKKVVTVQVKGGMLRLSFPDIKAGQALIAGIAIATTNKNVQPAPALQLITLQSKTGAAQTWLDAGDRTFIDGNVQFRSLPSKLYGADWIQQPRQQNADINFTIHKPADVFIGIDSALKPPAEWLAQMEATQTFIETDEGGSKLYAVYRKRYKKGEPVAVKAANYPQLIMIVPVDSMQAAFDLKKTTVYNIDKAILPPGVQVAMANEKECGVVNTNNPVMVEWPVHTGVADQYAITFKCYYPLQNEIKGRLQLINSADDIMLDEELSIGFTRPGKWNTLGFNTPGMINAGHYRVRFITEGGQQLAIRSIEIQ